MVERLIHFPEMQRMGYGDSARALRALCDRYNVPVLKLNKRQFALRESDYRLLLERASADVRKAA
jgi:hypothetical protein